MFCHFENLISNFHLLDLGKTFRGIETTNHLLQYSLGKAIERPVVVDLDLARDLQACAKHGDHFPTILGKTLCADDFYEGKHARKLVVNYRAYTSRAN